MPYSHPQSILKFIVLSGESDLNLISSGEDGTLRTWNFNAYTTSFDHIHCYEGHLRGVTGLAFNGTINVALYVYDCMTVVYFIHS